MPVLECPRCRMAVGPRAKFCSDCGAALRASSASAKAVAARLGAERRHLTVMFCDLVGSTALSTMLDPEDLGDLILRYRQLVQDEVARLGGFVARLFGDGILIYFGYPEATEGAAMQAVRAALRICGKVALLSEEVALPAAASLQVHVGIHTGLALVEAIGEQTVFDRSGIIGETPNLAARIEAMAPPGVVLVSAATHALTFPHFDYRAWGEVSLRGFLEPMKLYQPVAELDWRRQASARKRAQPLFGRTRETEALHAAWQRACAGAGQAILLSGDPGIGKTRLLQWTANFADAPEVQHFELACERDFANSSFWPIADAIRRQLSLTALSPSRQLRRLRRAVVRAGLDGDRSMPLLADLLALPRGATGGLEHLTQSARRLRLMELLSDCVAGMAERGPVLLTIDNVHWADASSLEWIGRLAGRLAGLRVLLLATTRLDVLTNWPGLLTLKLDRLASDDQVLLIDSLCPGRPLQPAQRQSVMHRSDGVPLFLEELVKTLNDPGSPGLGPPSAEIPLSLRDLLSSRLDHLGPAKRIARVGAVIGRQFTLALLQTLLDQSDPEIRRGLALLVEADIIAPVQAGPEPGFAFKHALLQDAAYEGLLRSERRDLHRKLAEAYPRICPDIARSEPETLAHHASAGGLYQLAPLHWWAAGEQAQSVAAYREALGHFQKGLQDVERLDPGPDRDRLIMRFCTASAAATIAVAGFAAPQVEALGRRAFDLISSATPPDAVAAALSSLGTYYQVRGPLARARELFDRLMQLAEVNDDDATRQSARRRQGWCLFCMGEMEAGQAMLASVVAHFRAEYLPVHGRLTETDTGVTAMASLGFAECVIGNFGAGLQHCADSRSRAVMLGSFPMDLAYALAMSAAASQRAGDVAAVLDFAGAALELSSRNALPYWRAWAMTLQGWAVAQSDDAAAGEAGLALVEDGLAEYCRTGARLFVPMIHVLAAEICLRLDRRDQAAELIDGGLAMAAEIDTRCVDADLLVLRAELQRRRGDRSQALATLDEALAVAERQGSKAMTLHARSLRDAFLKDGATSAGSTALSFKEGDAEAVRPLIGLPPAP